jgi:hypothetical protein
MVIAQSTPIITMATRQHPQILMVSSYLAALVTAKTS